MEPITQAIDTLLAPSLSDDELEGMCLSPSIPCLPWMVSTLLS